jgi:hypothetical protein
MILVKKGFEHWTAKALRARRRPSESYHLEQTLCELWVSRANTLSH